MARTPPAPRVAGGWESGPERAWIVTTSKCNLNCVHCARSIPEYRAEAEATPDMTEAVFDRFERDVVPTLRTVQFGGTNLGEPLLVCSLEQHVERLKRHGNIREIKIQTNGTHLVNHRRVEALVRAGARIMVSLEGVTAASYRLVRGVQLDHFTQGLEVVRAIQDRHPESGSELLLAFTVRYDTLAELVPLVELAARYRVSQVTVSFLIPMRESQRFQSPCYHRGEANAALAAAERRAADLGVGFVAPAPFQMSAFIEAPHAPNAESPGEPPCFHPWRSVSINERGDVMPCCATNAVMGNLMRDDFAAIWHSRRYRTLRARVNSARPPSYCRGCVLRGVNLDSPRAKFHTDDAYLLRGIGPAPNADAGELYRQVRRKVADRVRAYAGSTPSVRRAAMWLRSLYWRYSS